MTGNVLALVELFFGGDLMCCGVMWYDVTCLVLS